MRILQKSDIIGARIVDIHECCELLHGDLDYSLIYFTVDRGFSFVTPNAGFLWHAVEVPGNAKHLMDEVTIESFAVRRSWFGGTRFIREPNTCDDTVKQMKRRLIVGVYCASIDPDLGFRYPEEGRIVFDDGSQAFNTRVAPHGTGAAGLHYHTNSEHYTSLDELDDFFAIPVLASPNA